MNFSNPCPSSIKLIRKLRSLDRENKLNFTLIKEAIYWAKKYHEGQYRKSGAPYYTHPLKVAYLVADYRLNTEIIVASILHDIVEDTEVTLGNVVDKFGWRIAEIVDRLTRDRPDGTKLTVKQIIYNAYKNKDEEVLLIKLIDRLHNTNTAHFKSSSKIKILVSETLEDFITLAAYLGHIECEQDLSKLCILLSGNEFNYTQISLFPISRRDNYLLPALEFQSALSQIYTQIPQEA